MGPMAPAATTTTTVTEADTVGFLDDLRTRMAKALASEAAGSAVKQAEASASRVAEDLVGSAEHALKRAQGERDGRSEALQAAADQARQTRLDREARAQAELARLKAAHGTKGDDGEATAPTPPVDKTL